MENNQYNQSNPTVPPQNFLTLSIISSILGCCGCSGLGFIFGIIGVYFAAQVNARFNAGDIYGAEQNAKNAKIFSFIALGLFVFSIVASIVIKFMFPEIWEEQMETYRILFEQIEAAQAE